MRPFGAMVAWTVLEYVRFGTRVWKYRPVFALCVVLTFAFAIGANVAVFSVINALWLRPTVPQPERVGVVQVQAIAPNSARSDLLSVGVARLLSGVRGIADAAVEVVAEEVAGDARPRTVLGTDGRSLEATAVSHSYFRTLGVPLWGRGFLPEDDRPGTSPTVVLSHALWQSAFDQDTSIVGRSTVLSGRRVTIVGIAPDRFRGPVVGSRTDLWLPIGALSLFAPFPAELLPIAPVRVYGRLAERGTVPEVEAQLSKSLGRPVRFATLAESAYPLRLESRAGLDRRLLFVLATTVAVVLLIGCLNLTSLFLAHLEERRDEIGTRLALGASRAQLVTMLFAEVLVLAVMGVACAILVSEWLLRILRTFSLPSGTAISSLDASLDVRVAAFAVIATAGAAVATGAWPVIHASSTTVLARLMLRRDEGRTVRGHARMILLGSYVALSAVLLVAAALFVRSVQRALSADFGFSPSATLFLLVQPRVNQYASSAGAIDAMRRTADFAALLENVQRLPGVQLVARGPSPLTDRSGPPSMLRFVVDGRDRDLQAEGPTQVGPNYFSTLGVRLVAGRDFRTEDVHPGGRGAFIVSESLANRLWPNRSALGRRLAIGPWTDGDVVGVAPDIVRRGVRRAPSPSVYHAAEMTAEVGMLGLTIRTGVPPERLMPGVLSVARGLFPDATQLRAQTGEEQIRHQLASERLGATVFSFFGATAAILCVLGTFGLVTYLLARSRREWAIRIALGATPRRIVRSAVLRGIGPLIVGSTTGLGAAALSTRVIQSFMFDLDRLDPVSFAIAAAVLVVPGTMAAYVAARSLRRLDPAAGLRQA